MNAQLKSALIDRVTGWERGSQFVKGQDRKRKGYVLISSSKVLGFIETTGPHARLEELLQHFTRAVAMPARDFMRELLTIEDYDSTVYDVIVRVYYPEEFAS